jgi:hypothetical protein
VSLARPGDDAQPERVLSLANVLEEEFAALHPDEPPTFSAHAGFTKDDIADLPGFAQALLDGAARADAGRSGWTLHPRPPAPRSTPLSNIAAVVMRGEPSLAELLRATLASVPGTSPTYEPKVRQLLAARLTDLLAADLDHEPAFAPVVRSLRAQGENAMPTQPLMARNRLLLETAFAPFLLTTEDRRLASINARIHSMRHTALCLSGGGIRSASFAMGVVQRLARRGLLSRFHYMSTVSGGGYTGSWLSAWMARSGTKRVYEQLEGTYAGKPESEPAPLRHIRAYSYYLNPSLGLLSADTWTLIATIGRNILLIWLVALPVMAAALMLPRLFVAGPMTTLLDWMAMGIDPADLILILLAVGTVLAIAGIAFVQRNLYSYSGRDDRSEHTSKPVTVQRFIARCLVPLVLAMAALAQAWEMDWSLIRFSPVEARKLAVAGTPLTHRAWAEGLIALDPTVLNAQQTALIGAIGFWIFVFAVAWLIGARGRYRLNGLLLSALAGGLGGGIGGFASERLFGLLEWHHTPEFFATLAVPMSLMGLLVSLQVVVGLGSRRMTDAERESNARFSAWLLIAIVCWIGVTGIALFGPMLLHDAVGQTVRLRGLIGVGGGAGLLTSLLAATSGKSVPGASSGASGPASGKLVRTAQKLAMALAAPLFAVTVIVLISLLDGATLGAVCGVRCDERSAKADTSAVSDLFRHRVSGLIGADYASPTLVLAVFAGLLVIAYVLGRLIDTNRFSLHAMYRVRLVRTFLGASKPPGERQPNLFTGFDDTDDMPMGDLWPARRGADDAAMSSDALHPPLHVVNLTLNMVAGTDLATQSRKATSFTVTPLHAGCAGVGYRRTSAADDARNPLYGGRDGITLGTAMAVSGAAASPNAGYHSSPAVTFLMTLFNARLGWWLGNPGPAGRKSYGDDEPRLALIPILDEMFGRTTDHSPYVYLSDGGHFENLGLYEMVRRRCRFIVVSDAGCDPAGAFDDLGGAIRKIRIDFGIPIEFESGIPIYSRDKTNRPDDARYWAVGRILYSRADGANLTAQGSDAECDGVLLYIKPAFYGCEPRDVYNYGTKTPAFPHEGTGNQFFGETQFESYRALGAYAVDQMCKGEFGVPADSDQVVAPGRFDEWFRAGGAATPAAPPPT